MEEFAKKYFDLLTGEYASINLTRINNFDEFLLKQIKDSVLPLEQSELFKKHLIESEFIIDVGFGGGFPILPLAFLNPDKNFIGVETRGKKAKVVSEIATKLGLKNVKLVHERIENILVDKNCLITFKAVGKVNDFLSRINTDQIQKVYFYKGPNFYDIESEQFSKAKENWSVIEQSDLSLENVDGRLLVGFENKSVPCGTNKINQLVKVSSFT